MLDTCRFVYPAASPHKPYGTVCGSFGKSSLVQGGQAFASLLSYTGMLRHWRHILWSSSSGLWSLGSSTMGERHAGITTGSLASLPSGGISLKDRAGHAGIINGGLDSPPSRHISLTTFCCRGLIVLCPPALPAGMFLDNTDPHSRGPCH